MIPILYEKNETRFDSNGMGRLHDCISCVVTEERNGIYECDFEYPVNGARFDDIIPGRIVAVTHDDTGDIQPFDIVSFTRPISGVVTFHATHISYRQSGMVANGTNINSLADAFTMLEGASPSNPFTYSADFTSTAYMAAADGTPRSVRQFLGGIEGSILDAYGGEYEWDRFNVILHKSRGTARDFSIRYGVNMTNYQEDTDYQNAYTSCIPYWSGGDGTFIIGDRVDSGGTSWSGRDICVPLDLTDKFEDKPTKAQVETMALQYMTANQSFLPGQNITVDFVRLQDMGYDEYAPLLECRLCDTINVVFPFYNTSGPYKIVKTVWDVLADRYNSLELGSLSPTLAEALGLSNSLAAGVGLDQIVSQIETLDDRVDILNDYVELLGQGFTAGTTAARVTGLTVTIGNGECFTTGTNQATVNKTGYYFISVSFIQSATNNATSVKRVALYRNGSSLLGALSRANSWTTSTADAIYKLNANDVLTMYARDESGTGTYSYGRIIIIPLNV